MIFSLLLACDDGGDFDQSLDDANNYTYSNTIDVKVIGCTPGADVSFDWSGLTVDVQDHAMDPATDVTEMSALYFPNFDEAQLEDAIAADDIFMSDTQVILTGTNAGGTSVLLSDLMAPAGNEFDPAEYFVKEEGTWAIRLTENETIAHSVAFFRPDSTADNSAVQIDNETADVTFSADLHSLDVVQFNETDEFHIDWSDVKTAGDGQFFDPNKIDQVWLGRYDESVDELATQFFDLELIAEELDTIAISQTQEATIGADEFGGLHSGDTWLLALRCTSCTNPAPPFLTVIEVL